ncbi:magnesium transporter CorA family protein [Patescibacteria group bacterium]|nr:MAG: magnesium transporter CorA family protein [Patescibacteria group bacterium]
MLKYYYKTIRSSSLDERKKFQKGTWVYAENPTPDEITKLINTHGLDEGLIVDALDEDEMPRLEKDGNLVYVYVRAATTRTDGASDTLPLLIVYAPDSVITISLRKLPHFAPFFSDKLDFTTTQRTRLMLQILSQIAERYDKYITTTSKQIKTIRNRLRGHEIHNKDFIDFVTIEDEINEFLGALQPVSGTLRRIMLGRDIVLHEEDRDILEDLELSITQSIETCRSNIKSIINIRQAYSSISSNNLNRSIKILTIVTVMITLPNIFFSMYGMNVALPYQHEQWAFSGLLILIAVVLLISYAILKRKNVI